MRPRFDPDGWEVQHHRGEWPALSASPLSGTVWRADDRAAARRLLGERAPHHSDLVAEVLRVNVFEPNPSSAAGNLPRVDPPAPRPLRVPTAPPRRGGEVQHQEVWRLPESGASGAGSSVRPTWRSQSGATFWASAVPARVSTTKATKT